MHVSLMTRQRGVTACLEVLIPLLYSPNIETLDVHLFWSLWISLNGKKFCFLKDCERHLGQFFAKKDKNFGEDGIMKLPEKQQKVNMLFNKALGECVLFLLKNWSNFLANSIKISIRECSLKSWFCQLSALVGKTFHLYERYCINQSNRKKNLPHIIVKIYVRLWLYQ